MSKTVVLPQTDSPSVVASVSFWQAFRFWLKLGFISFGGPAGQIAMMHQELVDNRRWISEGRFLHALNFCMVLPGPEAQQLATYIGWLMHKTWGGIIAGVLFILPSLVLLIALAWMNRRGIWETSKKLMGMLAGLLATCIAVDGYMVGCELLTTGYPGSEGGWHVLSQMFFGATAPYFWIEIIVGVLIPFTILVFAKNRQKTGLIVFSSACVVVGVFCKRVWLLFSSFITPNTFGGPGLIDGTSAATSGMDVWAATSWYAPSWVEYAVLLGVIALGALAFLILVERFIMKAKPTDLIDADAAAHGVADAKASSPSC